MSKNQEFLIAFTSNELVYAKKVQTILGIDANNAKQIIFYYTKKWILKKIHPWFYIFDEKKGLWYELFFELWCVISNGYVSGEFVLSQAGSINADYSQTITFCTRKKIVDINLARYNITLSFMRISSKRYFFQPQWIHYKQWYAIASPARAVMDIFISTWIMIVDNYNKTIKDDLSKLTNILSIRQKKSYELAYTAQTKASDAFGGDL